MKTNLKIIFTKNAQCVARMLLVLGLPQCVQAQNTNLNFLTTQAAAERGDARAQYELGRDYQKGIGVDKDNAKAVQYLRLAAEQGYADAEVTLGSFYGQGLGVSRNVATAVSWYRKAADQGNALAQYAMGNF